MWHQCTLHQHSRLFCEFLWQLPHLRFMFCCLSSYWRISQSDQWDLQPWAAGVRRGQNHNQSHREMKDERVWRVALTQPSCTWSIWKGVGTWKENCCFAWRFGWVKKISATCVSRKVTLLELLLWVQTVWGIQRLYILFIVCVYAYSPVWCSPEVSVDAMWSTVGNPEVENRVRQQRPWVCGDVSAWLGVCRSLVHWTLPLHRFYFSLDFFFLSLTTSFGFHEFSFDRDNIQC